MRQLLALLALGSACVETERDPPPHDAGLPLDAAPIDVGVDAGSVDFGFPDSGVHPDGEVPDAGPSPCAPSLTLTPTVGAVLPLGLFSFTARGGSGRYHFEITTNRSGGLINSLTGAYLAGSTPGSDQIRLTDPSCVGESAATITVVEPMTVAPQIVQAPPQTRFDFEARGGTGRYTFRMLLAGSGGTVTPQGRYQAGMAGRDRVEIRDLGTGQTEEAEINVVADARFVPNPSQVFVPVGHTFHLRFEGGSGEVDLGTPRPEFSVADNLITGVRAGSVALTARDRFTGQTAPLRIDVVEPLRYPAVAFGASLFTSTVLPAGDLNGDGYPDAILAHPDTSLAGTQSGAVFVYAGQMGGLDPMPAQVFSGRERRDELGRAVALADVNGDGQSDLIIGAPRTDQGAADTGIVNIYLGRVGGFFETTPAVSLAGRFGGDLFGWSVAACDFNDDGFMDLAVGSFNSEDRARTPVVTDQGGVSIFMGNSAGFGDSATRTLWGDVPDPTSGWIGQAAMHHGIQLATADFNGDGVCDLAAATFEWDQSGNTNDGLVYVYQGVRASNNEAGGLSPRPVRAIANLDPADRGGALGRNLAAADLDADGLAELLISHHGFDATSDNANTDSHGAIRVFRGVPFTGEVTTLAPARPADWQVENNGSGDQYGFAPAAGDVNGDGRLDIVVGSLLDEVVGGPNDTGTVHVYLGRAGELPDPATPVISQGAAGDRYGAAVAVLGDVNATLGAELLVLAGYRDDFGEDLGALLLVSSDTAATPVALGLPTEPSGSRYGFSSAVVGDVTGDGRPDAVVGAFAAPVSTRGLQFGAAYLYAGSATGFEPDPALELVLFPQHSGSDNFGWSVAPVGDFDGDGNNDFAITARFEDLAASYPTAQYLSVGCTGSRSNSGAVFIFRGVASGLPENRAAFIYFGPQANQGTREITGGFDYDGDGLDDLLVGGSEWDRANLTNTGGFTLVRGRAADATRTVVLCQADFTFLGNLANDALGRSAAPAGDLNADGCDEFAVGAPTEDPVRTNEGTVRLFYGWGSNCSSNAPQMVVVRSDIANAQAGVSLFGGLDFDGDTIPDVATGMPGYAANGNTVGAAVVIPGAYLRSLPTEPAQDQTPPTRTFLLADAMRPPTLIVGQTAGEQLGSSVALVRGNFGVGLAAGAPRGDISGTILSGGARIYRYGATGIDTIPVAAFGGETLRPLGLLGESMHANGNFLLVGGSDGTSVDIDTGSVYPLLVR